MKILTLLTLALCAAAGLHADAVTITAAADPSAQAIAALLNAIGTTPASWTLWAMSIALGVFLAPWGQNVIEAVTKGSDNIMVKTFSSLVLGLITSTVTAYMGKTYGITPAMAASQLAVFLGVVHLFNGTPWAADLEKGVSLLASKSGAVLPILQQVALASGEPAVAEALGAIHAAQLATSQASSAPLPAPVAQPKVGA